MVRRVQITGKAVAREEDEEDGGEACGLLAVAQTCSQNESAPGNGPRAKPSSQTMKIA